METNLVVVDLKENLNSLDYPFLLAVSPKDIEVITKMGDLVKKYFNKNWVYTGSGKPRETNSKLIKEIEEIEASPKEKEKIKRLVTESKLPFELLIALMGGDSKEFHNHISDVSDSFQIEQYIVPENKEVVFDVQIDGNKHRVRIKGPSVLVIGPVNHRREEGECFVTKFPSGSYRNVV